MGPCWAFAPSLLCTLLSFYHSPSLHPRGLQTWLRHSSSAPCQSICIVARCSHCHARQSLPVSGITQLDGGHRRGHPGPSCCTKTVNLTTPSPAMTVGQETNLCVRLCLLALNWIQSSWTTLTYLPDKQFFLNVVRVRTKLVARLNTSSTWSRQNLPSPNPSSMFSYCHSVKYAKK